MKILIFKNTAINLAHLLCLKLEINKENPKKSYITITLNGVVKISNIIIEYEDLISDEDFEIIKAKAYDIEVFEPKRVLDLIYHYIITYITNEIEFKKPYLNIKTIVSGLINKSFENQIKHLENVA